MSNENKGKLVYQKQAWEILQELTTKDLLPKLEKMMVDDLEEETFFDETLEAFINQYQALRKQFQAYGNSDQSISFNTFLIKNK